MPISKPEYERICEAYLAMVKHAQYRPAAPSDLTEEQLADRAQLANEAHAYAVNFITDEDTCKHGIGVTDYSTNRAVVYAIEAARALCGAEKLLALKLLEMALAKVKEASTEQATCRQIRG